MTTKKRPMVIAALFRPMKLFVFPMSDSFRLKINKIPFVKLHSIKSPLENLEHLPALKVAKKDFYINARVTFNTRSALKTIEIDQVLKQQAGMMTLLIEEVKEEIRKETLEKYQRMQERRQQFK